MPVRTLLVAAVLLVSTHGRVTAQQTPVDTTSAQVHVHRPTGAAVVYLGFSWSHYVSNTRTSEPFVVTRVAENSPGPRAGLLAGDRIVAIDGEGMTETSVMLRDVAPGRHYRLTVQRGDQQLDLEIVPDPPRPVATH